MIANLLTRLPSQLAAECEASAKQPQSVRLGGRDERIREGGRECEHADCFVTNQAGMTYCTHNNCPVVAERKRKRQERVEAILSSMTEIERAYYIIHNRH